MKRVELKRIAEFLWKGTSPDEKTPFAAQGTLPDNGSFSKNFEADDNKKMGKEFPEDEDQKVEGPMSIPRKLCFVMSFNVWILYFVVFGWIIPCRYRDCGSTATFADVLETNLSSIWPLTNVETMNVKGLPSLAMLGYADGKDLKLAALATFDATFEWNNSVPFIPRNIQCNFANSFDANGDGMPDCLLSGYNDVLAFNASDGYVFWHRNLPSEKGNIISGFHPTSNRNNESYIIGVCGDKMVILNAKTGKKIAEISLPCDSPFEIMVVPNVISANLTLWSLVCDYGDVVEAWSFGEQDVLNRENSENKANASEFALLFSGSNSTGSIDLGCDVTPIPGGPLLLSWSDRVAMVTPEATAWERHFLYPLTVANIEIGHFSPSKDMQVAAAVHNGTNTIIVIMEMTNGSIIDSLTLENREAQSMEKIPGDLDLLVLKSLDLNSTMPLIYNFSDPIPTAGTNFALIDFRNGSFTVKDIVTTSTIVGSAINTQINGETDLLVIKTKNGNTSYQRYVIYRSEPKDIICDGVKNVAHYSFET